MRLFLVLTGLLMLSASIAGPGLAQDLSPAQRQQLVKVLREALVQDPSILRDALAALQADDVHKQERVTRDVIAMIGPRLVDPADPVSGNPLGDVTIVEFFDTRCPYCRRMGPVLADLLRSDPKVRLVMKDLPVLGPTSQLESRFLLAAQKQGGYFKLHDAVMQLGGASSRDSLRELADHLGLDGGRLARDVDDPAIKTRLQATNDTARQLGIEGTPAYVIGNRLIAGAADLAELQRAVAEARKR